MIHPRRTFLALVVLVTVSSAIISASHAAQSPAAAPVDYSISANPSSLTIQRGSSANSIITLRSHNFVGTVSLAAVVVPQGPSASLDPSTVSLMISSSATSKLTISTTSTTAPGTYVVKVNATALLSLITHETDIVVTVPGPDFTISASPTTLTLPADTNASATVTVSSLNGFTGTVQLTTILSSTTLNAKLDPTSVQLTSAGTNTTTLLIYTLCSTPVGAYSVQVMGAALGVGAHTAQISMTVEDAQSCHSSNPPPNPSPSPSPGPSSGPPQSPKLPEASNELLLGNALLALAIVIVVAAAALVFRRLWPEKWAGMRTGV